VELVSPDRQVWSGDADIVIARTVEGDIGIMAHHSPVLGVLAPAPVTIRRSDGDDVIAAVHGGFLSVTDQGVTILGEIIELASEIDVSRARSDLEAARSAGSDDAEAVARGQRASARLRAAGETA
jgi:F-type H+-transporting ATPase subunit epsilon